MQAILHTDGGSRGNPGPSGIGFVLFAVDGQELSVISEGGAFIGEATNNEAEYRALLWGLENARAQGVLHLSIRADSELMVKQIKGEYKVRSEDIKPLFEQAIHSLGFFESYGINHVYREENVQADILANKAMDRRESVGTFSVPCKQSAKVTDPIRRDMDTGYYTLTIKDHFDAAHALVGYPGACRQLHGHTWDIEVSVSGTELDEVGIVYDFKDLKKNLATILADYDHVYLNDIPPFDHLNATAEHLARVIYERMEKMLPTHISLVEIGVWESPIAKITYRKKKSL